jgi:hypothetical protein
MDVVFLLWHVHEIEPGNDDEKLIGVYRTEDDARSAIERSARNPDLSTFQTDFRSVRTN